MGHAATHSSNGKPGAPEAHDETAHAESPETTETKHAGSKHPDPKEPQQSERRRHNRVNLATRVWVFELDDGNNPGPPQPGECADISCSGLGFRSRRMYYSGRRVIAMLD